NAVAAGAEVSKTDLDANKLVFHPAANANGSPYGTFTFQVRDDGGTANAGVDLDQSANTLTANVTSVNDVPSFTKGADPTVLEDAGAQSAAGWATAISAGPPDESGQALNFIVTNNNNGLFTAAGQPAVDSSGKLTYTPASNANGSALVYVKLHDDGGTANGGVDTSAVQTFTINVTAVNDVPSFTKGSDQTVLEDAGAQSVPGWATAISAGPPDVRAFPPRRSSDLNNNGLFTAAGQPAV